MALHRVSRFLAKCRIAALTVGYLLGLFLAGCGSGHPTVSQASVQKSPPPTPPITPTLAPTKVAVVVPSTPPQNIFVDSNHNETSIAANPLNPLNLVASANPNYGVRIGNGYPAVAYSSKDAGKTWQPSYFPIVAPYYTHSDTSLAFDGQGTIYAAMLGLAPNVCGSESAGAAILVTRSSDGGQAWETPVIVDQSPLGERVDKPYVGVDRVHGTISLTWTRFLVKEGRISGGSKIMYARSTDGGQNFTTPRLLFRSESISFGAVPVSGPSGEVYVVWSNRELVPRPQPGAVQMYSITSPDEGITWNSPVLIASFKSLPRLLNPGQLRIFSIPTVAVNQHSGVIYVAWPATRRNPTSDLAVVEADILLSRSLDRGVHWSTPVAVNDRGDGDRFMPQMSIGPDSTLALAFYDRRSATPGDGHSDFALYSVGVRDNGDSLSLWPNRQVSQAASQISYLLYLAPGSTCFSPGRFMGDYIGIATDSNGVAHVLWADTQSQEQNVTAIRSATLTPLRLSGGPPRKQIQKL